MSFCYSLNPREGSGLQPSNLVRDIEMRTEGTLRLHQRRSSVRVLYAHLTQCHTRNLKGEVLSGVLASLRRLWRIRLTKYALHFGEELLSLLQGQILSHFHQLR